jgi:hypothetical protein
MIADVSELAAEVRQLPEEGGGSTRPSEVSERRQRGS